MVTYRSSSFKKEKGFWVLSLKEKTSYDAGYTQGMLFKKAKHPMYTLFTKVLIIFLIRCIHFIFRSSFRKLHIPKPYKDELKGLSDATKIPYDVLFFLNFSFDVFKRNVYCSTFNFFNKGKDVLVGRNTDMKRFIGVLALRYEASIIYRMKVGSSHQLTHVGFPFCIGVLNGYNEKGICVNAHLTLGLRNGNLDSNLYSNILILRTVLQEAETLDEAKQILRTNRISRAKTALITSARERASFVYEAYPRRYMFVPQTKEHFQGCTMHFQSRKMKRYQFGRQRGSKKRLSFMNKTLKNQAKLSTQEAITLLRDTSNGLIREESGFSITNTGTFQSFIFYPLKDTILISDGKKLPVSLSGEYKELSF